MTTNAANGLSRSQVVSELASLMEQIESLKRRLEKQNSSSTEIEDPPFLDLVRRSLSARELRKEFFDEELFVNTPWDVLMKLYEAHLEDKVIYVSQLDPLIGSALTTIIRWIDELSKANLVQRVADPADRRRFSVRLTKEGERAIEAYFTAVKGIAAL